MATTELGEVRPTELGEVRPTELRVHGVSGTAAEDMLDRKVIGRVAGDAGAGFYRPRPEYGLESTIGPGGARLEAYRWGSLTAGAASRAFWLLLLPFTLANVAVWLRPPSKGLGRAMVRWICRVFALSITATFTLGSIGVGMDLLAYQCAAPGTSCVQNRRLLTSWFTGYFEPTGRRLALSALVPVVLVSVLWFLARRTWSAYESYHGRAGHTDGDGLAAPTFWDGRAQVGRLRLVHVATSFAIIDAVLLYVLLRHDQGGASFQGVDLAGLDPDAVVGLGAVLGMAAVVLLAAPILLFMFPGIVDRDSHSALGRAVSVLMLVASLLLTVLTLTYAMLPRAPWPSSGPLPGYATTVTWVFAGQTGLLALLTLVVLGQRHRCRGALFGGFGAPVAASLALGLGGAFAAGVSYRVADYLDGGAAPSPANFGLKPQSLRLEPPVSYQWAAFGFLLMIVIVVLGFLWISLVTGRRLRRAARRDTDEDFPGGRRADRARAMFIDDRIANARLTDHVRAPIAAMWVLLAIAGVTATAMGVSGKGPVELATSGSHAAVVLHNMTSIGTYLISFSALVLILLGIQTYRNERVRRTVGVIWDLATFWPRAAHPLAPPCYAERVVPELVHRASYLATQEGGVILSGHSQGSVLIAATVLQMPPEARARTAMLTYGSPLRRLYARAFPAYLDDGVLLKIAAMVAGPDGEPRWRNLWRRTDPIGGEVGISDVRMTDPAGFTAPPGDSVPPAVCGHSGYQMANGFGDAVAGLGARLPR